MSVPPANSILNSSKPAIKNFLDELEEYNPGAKTALAASIARYRVTATVVARVVARALFLSLFRVLILCVNCEDPSRPFREKVDHIIGPATPI